MINITFTSVNYNDLIIQLYNFLKKINHNTYKVQPISDENHKKMAQEEREMNRKYGH